LPCGRPDVAWYAEKTAVNQISATSVTGYGKTGHTSPLLVTNQSGTDQKVLLVDGCLDAHGRDLVAERVLFDGLVSAGRDIYLQSILFGHSA
jgi:hypothetical protein